MGKIKELDGLRGLLAVWVVGVHLVHSVGVSPGMFGFFAPLFGAHLRVQMFCVLSGFVIFLLQSRHPQTYGSFVFGRVMRLYPVYITAFALSVLMAGIALTATLEAPFAGARHGSRIDVLTESLAAWPAHVLAHLTLLHGVVPDHILPNAAYAFLGQAWNISTEFQFYVVAPLLFLGLATGPLWRRLVTVCVCVLVWYALRNWPNPADLAQYAPYFALGIGSFALWQRDWRQVFWLTPLIVTLGAVAVFAMVDMAAGLWLFVLGWLLLQRDRDQDRGKGRVVLGWLATRPMQWLGEISYSLYLLHMIPLYLGMYLINGLGLPREAYLGVLSAITFGLAIPISWASTHWIEQRLYRRAVSVKRPDSVVAV
ncbi:MAG: acyltransferase family protein [Paracoccaceae bacterium]